MSDKHEDGQLPRPPALPVAPRLASIIMSRDGQSEQALVVSPREAQVVAVTHPLMVVQPVNTGSSPYHGTPSPIEPPSITFLQSQSLWTHSVTSGEEIRQAVWGHFSLHDKVEMCLCLLLQSEMIIRSPSGEMFNVSLPFPVARVFPLEQGLLADLSPTIDSASHSSTLPPDFHLLTASSALSLSSSSSQSQPFPYASRLFSLSHPLEDWKPVFEYWRVCPPSSSVSTTVLHEDETVICSVPAQPMILTYSSTNRQHSLWVLRQVEAEVMTGDSMDQTRRVNRRETADEEDSDEIGDDYNNHPLNRTTLGLVAANTAATVAAMNMTPHYVREEEEKKAISMATTQLAMVHQPNLLLERIWTQQTQSSSPATHCILSCQLQADVEEDEGEVKAALKSMNLTDAAKTNTERTSESRGFRDAMKTVDALALLESKRSQLVGLVLPPSSDTNEEGRVELYRIGLAQPLSSSADLSSPSSQLMPPSLPDISVPQSLLRLTHTLTIPCCSALTVSLSLYRPHLSPAASSLSTELRTLAPLRPPPSTASLSDPYASLLLCVDHTGLITARLGPHVVGYLTLPINVLPPSSASTSYPPLSSPLGYVDAIWFMPSASSISPLSPSHHIVALCDAVDDKVTLITRSGYAVRARLPLRPATLLVHHILAALASTLSPLTHLRLRVAISLLSQSFSSSSVTADLLAEFNAFRCIMLYLLSHPSSSTSTEPPTPIPSESSPSSAWDRLLTSKYHQSKAALFDEGSLLASSAGTMETSNLPHGTQGIRPASSPHERVHHIVSMALNTSQHELVQHAPACFLALHLLLQDLDLSPLNPPATTTVPLRSLLIHLSSILGANDYAEMYSRDAGFPRPPPSTPSSSPPSPFTSTCLPPPTTLLRLLQGVISSSSSPSSASHRNSLLPSYPLLQFFPIGSPVCSLSRKLLCFFDVLTHSSRLNELDQQNPPLLPPTTSAEPTLPSSSTPLESSTNTHIHPHLISASSPPVFRSAYLTMSPFSPIKVPIYPTHSATPSSPTTPAAMRAGANANTNAHPLPSSLSPFPHGITSPQQLHTPSSSQRIHAGVGAGAGGSITLHASALTETIPSTPAFSHGPNKPIPRPSFGGSLLDTSSLSTLTSLPYRGRSRLSLDPLNTTLKKDIQPNHAMRHRLSPTGTNWTHEVKQDVAVPLFTPARATVSRFIKAQASVESTQRQHHSYQQRHQSSQSQTDMTHLSDASPLSSPPYNRVVPLAPPTSNLATPQVPSNSRRLVQHSRTVVTHANSHIPSPTPTAFDGAKLLITTPSGREANPLDSHATSASSNRRHAHVNVNYHTMYARSILSLVPNASVSETVPSLASVLPTHGITQGSDSSFSHDQSFYSSTSLASPHHSSRPGLSPPQPQHHHPLKDSALSQATSVPTHRHFPPPSFLHSLSLRLLRSHLLVSVMVSERFTTRDLSLLPVGLAAPLHEALVMASHYPSGSWPHEAYILISRPDLATTFAARSASALTAATNVRQSLLTLSMFTTAALAGYRVSLVCDDIVRLLERNLDESIDMCSELIQNAMTAAENVRERLNSALESTSINDMTYRFKALGEQADMLIALVTSDHLYHNQSYSSSLNQELSMLQSSLPAIRHFSHESLSCPLRTDGDLVWADVAAWVGTAASSVTAAAMGNDGVYVHVGGLYDCHSLGTNMLSESMSSNSAEDMLIQQNDMSRVSTDSGSSVPPLDVHSADNTSFSPTLEDDVKADDSGFNRVEGLASLRFFSDQRLKEVGRLLSSSRVICVSVPAARIAEVEQEGGDLDLEYQARLLLLIHRVLALPIGRGCFTSASITAQTTELFPIPAISRIGRLYPKNNRVSLDLTGIEVSASALFDWPAFHNACAAGLRLRSHPRVRAFRQSSRSTLEQSKDVPTDAFSAPHDASTFQSTILTASSSLTGAWGADDLPSSRSGGVSAVTRTWIQFNRTQREAAAQSYATAVIASARGPAATATASASAALAKTMATASHAGFLFALGVLGHLPVLAPADVFAYLYLNHDPTTIAVLLGMATSRVGSCSPHVSKTLCLYLPSLVPLGFQDVERSAPVQVAAIAGLGFLFQGSGNRLLTEFCLSQVTTKEPTRKLAHREGFALSASMAVGVVNLAAARTGQISPTAADAAATLFTLIGGHTDGGGSNNASSSQNRNAPLNRDPSRRGPASQTALSPDVTAPGALLALALIFIRSNQRDVAQRVALPATQYQLDFVRPDAALLRVLARSLILWDSARPTVLFLSESLPDIVRNRVVPFPPPQGQLQPTPSRALHNSFVGSDDTLLRQVYCSGVAGVCYALGLKYAGTAASDVSDFICHYLKCFKAVRARKDGAAPSSESPRITSDLHKLDRPTLEMCIAACASALGMVLAGTGDLSAFRLLRSMRYSIDRQFIFAQSMALHQAIGFLFLGGGRLTFSNSPESIVALLYATYPRWPLAPDDHRFHLQPLRHMYIQATEPRALHGFDVDTGRPVHVPLRVVLTPWAQRHHGRSEIRTMSPCLLPPWDSIQSIHVEGPRFWPLSMDYATNPAHRLLLHSRRAFYVQRRAGFMPYLLDPLGFKSIVELSSADFDSHRVPSLITQVAKVGSEVSNHGSTRNISNNPLSMLLEALDSTASTHPRHLGTGQKPSENFNFLQAYLTQHDMVAKALEERGILEHAPELRGLEICRSTDTGTNTVSLLDCLHTHATHSRAFGLPTTPLLDALPAPLASERSRLFFAFVEAALVDCVRVQSTHILPLFIECLESLRTLFTMRSFLDNSLNPGPAIISISPSATSVLSPSSVHQLTLLLAHSEANELNPTYPPCPSSSSSQSSMRPLISPSFAASIRALLAECFNVSWVRKASKTYLSRLIQSTNVSTNAFSQGSTNQSLLISSSLLVTSDSPLLKGVKGKQSVILSSFVSCYLVYLGMPLANEIVNGVKVFIQLVSQVKNPSTRPLLPLAVIAWPSASPTALQLLVTTTKHLLSQ